MREMPALLLKPSLGVCSRVCRRGGGHGGRSTLECDELGRAPFVTHRPRGGASPKRESGLVEPLFVVLMRLGRMPFFGVVGGRGLVVASLSGRIFLPICADAPKQIRGAPSRAQVRFGAHFFMRNWARENKCRRTKTHMSATPIELLVFVELALQRVCGGGRLLHRGQTWWSAELGLST